MKRTAVVTGASKGIGYETALALAEEHDYAVVAISRSLAGLEQLSAAHKNIAPFSFDLLARPLTPLIDFLAEMGFEKLDILVNNAGLLIKKPLMQLDDDDVHRTFDVNFFAPFRLIRTLMPLMSRSTAAHIVNISSMGGFQGSKKFPGLAAYSSSKGALAVFTECLAEELKDTGISSNCLCLGAVATEMLSEAFPGYQAPVSAAEMGAFVARFAHENHHFMNGRILPVAVSTP
jgi:NAD(P)-dependent dehydrogenase (short-subunit alcohol dehydrogenase family)